MTNLPYFQDSLGIMVMTEVTADGLTYQMWLPVMDSKNKAMKKEPYTYQAWDNYSKQYVEKTVNAATMFDINKTIMRTLVKNLSMFGLGLYIYAGEDLPESEASNAEASSNAQQTQAPQKRSYTKRSSTPQQNPRYIAITNAINACPNVDALIDLYHKHQSTVDNDPYIMSLFSNKKQQLQNAI